MRRVRFGHGAWRIEIIALTLVRHLWFS